jgi:hypothetical protein
MPGRGFPFGGRFRGSANIGDTVPPASIGLAGSIEIDGEYWAVVGVILDGSDESNVYAPSSITGGSAVTLAALLGSKAVTPSRAKSELKAFGVNESAYDFIPMPEVWRAFNERADVALSAAAAAIGIFLAFKAAAWAIGVYRARREEEEAAMFHATDINKSYGTDTIYRLQPTKISPKKRAWGVAGVCLAVPALAAAVLFLAQRAVPLFLSWQSIYALADAKPALQFANFLAPLQSSQSMGFSALWSFLGLVSATLLAAIASSTGSAGDSSEMR